MNFTYHANHEKFTEPIGAPGFPSQDDEGPGFGACVERSSGGSRAPSGFRGGALIRRTYMKRRYASPALAALAVLFGGAARSQSLIVGSASAAPGTTLSVSVSTDASVSRLAGVQFTLDFGGKTPSNAPNLTVNAAQVTAGSLLSGALVTANPTSPTTLNVAVVGTDNRSGAGATAVIPLVIPGNAPDGATYALRLTNIQGADSNGTSVRLSGQAGTLTVSGPTPPPSGGDSGFALSAGTGPAGGTATVDLSSTSRISDLTSFTIKLQYDSVLSLSAADVAFTGVLSGLTLVNDKTPGISVIGDVGTSPLKQPGILARLTFHISSQAKPGATYVIKVTDLQAADSKAQKIATTASDGQVTVSNSPVTLPAVQGGLISVGSVKVAKGGVAQVTISANDKIKNLSGALFHLTFGTKTPANAPDLAYVSDGAAAGSLMKGALVNVIPVSDTEIAVGIVSAVAANGPGPLATLSFQTSKTGPNGAAYSLEVKGLTLSVNGSDMTSASSGGTITVTNHKKGDVNGDDAITISDVTTALRAALGSLALDDDQLSGADLNGDGKVSISEVTLILRAALGLQTLDG
jgi:hypothetical protein